MKKWEFKLPLSPSSKSNRRVFVRPGLSIKNPKANSFTYLSITLIHAQAEPSPFEPDDEIEMFVTVRYPSWRSDLDCELVRDVLEKAGVVHNDRQIRVKHYQTDDPPDPDVYTEIRLESHRKLQKKTSK